MPAKEGCIMAKSTHSEETVRITLEILDDTERSAGILKNLPKAIIADLQYFWLLYGADKIYTVDGETNLYRVRNDNTNNVDYWIHLRHDIRDYWIYSHSVQSNDPAVREEKVTLFEGGEKLE